MTRKMHQAIAVTGAFLVIILWLVLVLALGSCGSPASTGNLVAETPVSVQQLPSAREIAAQLGGTRYEDRGPAMLAGVVSSGTFWIGKDKYAVDTFMTREARDAWLKASEKFGVSPKWMTSTSVVYPSVLRQFD